MSRGGMILRISVSTRSASRAVSSMRVPVLARMCRMNWPLSVFGKEILAEPRHQREDRDAAQRGSPE